MELIALGIGFIVNTFAKNKEVQSAVDDFVSGSVKMVRGWFSGKDQELLLKKLEAEPESEEVKAELSDSMSEMVKDDQFKSMLEKWVAENQKPKPSMKNVIMNSTINAGGDVKIGDEKVSNQVVNKKNMVKSSNITAGGDFILGDK